MKTNKVVWVVGESNYHIFVLMKYTSRICVRFWSKLTWFTKFSNRCIWTVFSYKFVMDVFFCGNLITNSLKTITPVSLKKVDMYTEHYNITSEPILKGQTNNVWNFEKSQHRFFLCDKKQILGWWSLRSNSSKGTACDDVYLPHAANEGRITSTDRLFNTNQC